MPVAGPSVVTSPAEEITRTMGVSRATVHVHLSQGRRRLRRLLEGNDA